MNNKKYSKFIILCFVIEYGLSMVQTVCFLKYFGTTGFNNLQFNQLINPIHLVLFLKTVILSLLQAYPIYGLTVILKLIFISIRKCLTYLSNKINFSWASL